MYGTNTLRGEANKVKGGLLGIERLWSSQNCVSASFRMFHLVRYCADWLCVLTGLVSCKHANKLTMKLLLTV